MHGDGQISKKYILDIFDKGTEKRPGMFIRPNAIMRLLMLTGETIFNQVKKCFEDTGKGGMGGMLYQAKDPLGGVILLITILVVVSCGIFASIQYFIGALEFTLITSVGVFLLPFVLWDGSKFMTEKLVGAILGQAVKLLFITLAMMITINGYLALMVREFDGFFDQAIYTCFISFFYLLICQHAPALATALLSGTPQLSMGEGLATAGTMAAGGVLTAKGAIAGLSGGAKAAVKAKSGIDKARGAAQAAAADGKGGLGQLAAAGGSIKDSAVDSLKSGATRLSQSLTGGKGGQNPVRGGGDGGGGAGGGAGYGGGGAGGGAGRCWR